MSEPEPNWIPSKWKAEELDKQRVEFRLVGESGTVSGFGEFWARSRSLVDDLIHVQIVVEQQPEPHRIVQTLFPISEKSAGYIALHPDQSVARFQLLEP
jgi:hypothetical protein